METCTPALAPSNEPKPRSTRTRKPKAADAARGKRSLNLSLPVEDYERLAIHALREDIHISDLVCRLAREHLREYHITRTPSRDAS